jgi:phosphoribosyl-AMP cyclohydrolase / phosphoribosyl-ATP pyrophosphohydrolase
MNQWMIPMSTASELKLSIPIEMIRYNDQGLVPAIAQDCLDGTVLMLAWMNRESIAQTLATGEAHYWSRSRQELWHKGATSGHVQLVQSIRYDCDSDAILLTIDQVGDIACHTGERSCFHQRGDAATEQPQISAPPADMLSQVFGVICDRRDHPNPESYTCKLLAGGDNKILKKVGEESAEVVMAFKDDIADEIAGEVADLFYHVLVGLAHHHVDIRDVYRKLQSRRR